MKVFPKHVHRIIYLTGLGISAFFIPLSVFMISVGIFTVVINWLISSSFKENWGLVKQNTPLILFLLIYLVYLTGLINSENYESAFNALQIGLPLLCLPLVIGTSEQLNVNEILKILTAFITGTLISSLFSFYKIFAIHGNILEHMKEISPFIFHIRLAICCVTSITFLPWIYQHLKNKTCKFALPAVGLWFTAFLYVFQCLTGIIILLSCISVFIIIKAFKSKNILIKWGVLVFGLTFVLLTLSSYLKFYVTNFSPGPVKLSSLEKYTQGGNLYTHDTTSYWVENGRYVNLYICNSELKKEWEARSSLKFEGNDKEGNKLSNTLTRYLTGKDLTKDSAGIWQLSDNDIKNIENGVSNPVYISRNGLKSRTYRAMWELYHYYHGASPAGYSIPQRIEYYKTACQIIRKNFWLGTGIGDIKDAMEVQYKANKTELSAHLQLNVHNQFLTYFLAFGITGFIIICIAIFVPPAISDKYKSYLFTTFLFISVLSMFSIDLLAKHTGVTFFALFYSVFLFGETEITGISSEKSPE